MDAAEGIPSVTEAVAASITCLARLGLPRYEPEVVADGYSVRVRLGPVVTRVFTRGRVLRGDPLPWMRREVEVAAWLTARGVPVVAPWPDPGPHLIDGLEVSLWTAVDVVPGEVSQPELGALLGSLHAELADYPTPLPLLVGPLTDIATALDRCDDRVLHAAAELLLPLTSSWPQRPLHGDVHTENVLLTDSGPRWIDFEDVCVGPIEWDLASRTVTDAAMAAYPVTLDPVLLADCRDLRRLQLLACVLTDDVQEPSLYAEVTTALAHRLAAERPTDDQRDRRPPPAEW